MGEKVCPECGWNAIEVRLPGAAVLVETTPPTYVMPMSWQCGCGWQFDIKHYMPHRELADFSFSLSRWLEANAGRVAKAIIHYHKGIK